MNFVDLHVHTNFTVGNATTEISDLTGQAKAFGMKSLAITDSASIAGFASFAESCKADDIKPVFGCGFYFTPGSRFDHRDEKYHVVLLAENNFGFANILRLMALAYEEGYYKKPRIDLKSLQEHSRGIICLTGGLGGIVDRALLLPDMKLAERWVKDFHKIFGSNSLFLELQRNGKEESKKVEEGLRTLAEKYDLRCVATGGSFYLKQEDAEECNALRKRKRNKQLEGNGYYFRSPKEMAELFGDMAEAVEISNEIADRCKIAYDFSSFKHKTKDPRERLYELMEFFGVEALALP